MQSNSLFCYVKIQAPKYQHQELKQDYIRPVTPALIDIMLNLNSQHWRKHNIAAYVTVAGHPNVQICGKFTYILHGICGPKHYFSHMSLEDFIYAQRTPYFKEAANCNN